PCMVSLHEGWAVCRLWQSKKGSFENKKPEKALETLCFKDLKIAYCKALEDGWGGASVKDP
ncbi:MAG: hypothetical protein RSE18_16120, partial [Acinetobacter sp.]